METKSKKRSRDKAKIVQVRVEDLQVSTLQPRTKFDDAKIAELARSISAHGILQPLIIRTAAQGFYEIVAGERRYRAAKLAGLTKLPCMLMNMGMEKALAVALVENIQREDLNPIEEAQAYARLKIALGLSQEEVAERVGKDRSSVANTIRLLRLPKPVQDMVVNQGLSMGHARALLALDNHEISLMVAKKIYREGLSVRKTESIIRAIKSGHNPLELKKMKTETGQDILQKDVQRKLEQLLGARVFIKKEHQGYILAVHFPDLGRINEFLEMIGVEI